MRTRQLETTHRSVTKRFVNHGGEVEESEVRGEDQCFEGERVEWSRPVRVMVRVTLGRRLSGWAHTARTQAAIDLDR